MMTESNASETASPAGIHGTFLVMHMPNGDQYGLPVKFIEDGYVAGLVEDGECDEEMARQQFTAEFGDNDDALIEHATENLEWGDVKPTLIKLKIGGEWDGDALESAWADNLTVEMTVETIGTPAAEATEAQISGQPVSEAA